MIIPEKNRREISKYLFQEGVCYAKKDFNLAKHPEIDLPNLQVIKLMQSFKSKEYARETFAWMQFLPQPGFLHCPEAYDGSFHGVTRDYTNLHGDYSINEETLENRVVVQPEDGDDEVDPHKLYPTTRVQGREFRIVLSDLLMELVDLHKSRRYCGLICPSTIVVWQARRAGSLSWKAKLVPEYTPRDSDDLMHEDFVQLANMMEHIIGPEIPRDAHHLLLLLHSPRPDYVLTQRSRSEVSDEFPIRNLLVGIWFGKSRPYG
ncbi:hypothetical protein Tsubulata_038514 [Turnera subulata]|uniref:Plectin/eS10 N-terminal domain-containing protein n=1 Tax=Turnera subulata TaxID=218843 RepID=A0A9Q0FA46_9ROSI|nr:hypothetical protein Tsubulata_038514 [Turnera subulata]